MRSLSSSGNGCSKVDDVIPVGSRMLRWTYSSNGTPLTRWTM
jgi:hypothetical protein